MERLRVLSDGLGLLLLIVAVVLLSGLCMRTESSARARADENWPVWTDDAKLSLGICLRAEADGRAGDYAGMSWVLVKLWRFTSINRGWSIDDQIRNYCGVFKNENDRALSIRESSWEEPLFAKRKRERREWAELQEWVEAFVDGEIDDPLPLSEHWGGVYDTPPEHWIIISRPPLTANTFYRTKGFGDGNGK